jgi:hypothetical protein
VAKQLIVVVHGVGVKQAGQSSDLLATALDRTPEKTAKLSRAEIVRMQTDGTWLRPHSTDDFVLRELGTYNVDDKRRTFPARIRRYRQYGPNDQMRNERVIADYFWGDISTVSTSLAGLLVAILKTVLGISHAIRENARSEFPGVGAFDRTMRCIAGLAPLTIHGPIAAINLVLVGSAAVGWLLQKYGPAAIFPEWSPAVAGIFAALAGYGFMRGASAYLSRLLFGWILVFGLVLLIFQIGDWTTRSLGWSDLLGRGDDFLVKRVCNGAASGQCPELFRDIAPGADSATTRSNPNLLMFGMRLVAIMVICWLIVSAAALAVGVVSLANAGERKKRKVASLSFPAIALMTMLWLLMISGVWATLAGLRKLGWDASPDDIVLNASFVGLPLDFAFLLLLAVAGLYLNHRKGRELSRTAVATYKAFAEALAARHRLIVARGLLAILAAFMLVTTWLTLVIAIGANDKFTKGLLAGFNSLTQTTLSLSAAIGALLVGGLATYASAGLGIVSDVLTYLNDYSWNSKEPVAMGKRVRARGGKTRNWIERGLGVTPKNWRKGGKRGYFLRERIKNRLKVLVDELIANERPNHLAIVSHSQGTVIALDVLDEAGPDWRAKLDPSGGEPTVRLVTMGSPYTHIHGHYFPKSFPPVAQRQNLARSKVLSDWINIFRVDDFVGTHVDPEGVWPREHPVPPNGHTMYWTDENVFPLLRDFLEIDQPEREAARTRAARGKPAREGRARGRVKRR